MSTVLGPNCLNSADVPLYNEQTTYERCYPSINNPSVISTAASLQRVLNEVTWQSVSTDSEIETTLFGHHMSGLRRVRIGTCRLSGQLIGSTQHEGPRTPANYLAV